MPSIKLIMGDITKLEVDAIVNAANERLLGGGGVDGAIHMAAGSELYDECKKIGGCPTGEARVTKGYDLPAKHIIHTVGPIWQGGQNGEKEKLASCYKESLKLAEKNDIKTIAFPSISTGAFRFPIEIASQIAISEVYRYFLENQSELNKIVFVIFKQNDYEIYKKELDKLNIHNG